LKFRLTEDWLAFVLGLLIFTLSLGQLFGLDVFGWAVTATVWTSPTSALAPISKAYAALGGAGAWIATFIFLAGLLTAGAYALGVAPGRFLPAFNAIFCISYLCWFAGSWARIAVRFNRAGL